MTKHLHWNQLVVSTEINGIHYEALQQTNIEGTAECLTKAYFVDPKTQMCFKDIEEYGEFHAKFFPFARSICESVFLRGGGPGIIATNRRGIVVGALISEDFSRPRSQESLFHLHVRVPAEMRPVMELLKQLDKAAMSQHRQILASKTLHVVIEGVLPEYRYRGIGSTLLHLMLRVAEEMEYTYVVGESTTAGTQHIVFSLKYGRGCKKGAEIYYKDFRYRGEKVFAGIEKRGPLGCPSAMFVYKKLK
jgi:ribosomal protein S18 acetylase RimI-like enzyme